MINILTIHWKSDQWIDIQLKYLNLYINEPSRVYAFLNFLPRDHSDKFFYASTEPITDHAEKLNLLADKVCSSPDSQNEDILIFLDGDAFPIQVLMPFVYEKLEHYPLIAVQRKENHGDIQPHPLFCATTIQFWRKIQGDWHKGYEWINNKGDSITDVGGNLLKILLDNQVDWYPLLRSNLKNYHPIFFGIYDKIIYHHGGGFRRKWTRMDGPNAYSRFNRIFTRIGTLIPKNRLTAPLIAQMDFLNRAKKKIVRANNAQSQEIYEKILVDPNFFREFLEN